MKRLRPTLEDLVFKGESYSVFDNNVAFELLKRVDAQDAMRFAQAFGADNRYQSFLTVLRQDKIWKYWMERDLEVLKTTGDGTFESLLWEIPKEKRKSTEPVYKIYYLWYRLIISAYQSDILAVWQENSARYGPSRRLTFIRLNEFEETRIIRNANTVLYDFRSEHSRLQKAIPVFLNTRYDLRTTSYTAYRPFESFLRRRYPKFADSDLEITARICLEIFNGMKYAPKEPVDSGLNPLQLDMIYTVPRMKGPSYVLVAAPCLQCRKETEFREVTNMDRFFCNTNCQDGFYMAIEGEKRERDERLQNLQSEKLKEQLLLIWDNLNMKYEKDPRMLRFVQKVMDEMEEKLYFFTDEDYDAENFPYEDFPMEVNLKYAGRDVKDKNMVSLEIPSLEDFNLTSISFYTYSIAGDLDSEGVPRIRRYPWKESRELWYEFIQLKDRYNWTKKGYKLKPTNDSESMPFFETVAVLLNNQYEFIDYSPGF